MASDGGAGGAPPNTRGVGCAVAVGTGVAGGVVGVADTAVGDGVGSSPAAAPLELPMATTTPVARTAAAPAPSATLRPILELPAPLFPASPPVLRVVAGGGGGAAVGA